jgi:predicted TIM-barrel fold metal-dependent hydrolase
MFGTDYPMIDPEPWLEQFAALEFPEEIQRKILRENAESFLDLD